MANEDNVLIAEGEAPPGHLCGPCHATKILQFTAKLQESTEK